MRILFNGFQWPFVLPVLLDTVRRLDVKFCSTIDYVENDHDLGPGVEVLRHDFKKILWGEYPVPEHQLKPLDESVIFSMAQCETEALRMMDHYDGVDPVGWTGSYGQRKRLYLRHLRYWNDFLDRYNINCFISTNVPHCVHDYMLMHLCERRGIRSLMFYQTHIPDTSLLFDDYRKGPVEVEAVMARLAQEESAGGKIELHGRFDQYWKVHTDTEKDPVPFYMNKPPRPPRPSLGQQFQSAKQRLGTAGKHIARLSRQYHPPRLLLRPESRTQLRQAFSGYFAIQTRLKNETEAAAAYAELSTEVDFAQKYVYVPLHFQPEMTTSPLGGAFVDQSAMIGLLAASLPPGVLLYVKEHPVRSRLRSRTFYRDLLAIPEVRLVRTDVSTFQLMSNAVAVATVTGTAGFEALFYGKPVLMFGNVYYQYAPGVFRVKTAADCQSAVAKIFAGEKPTPAGMRRFLRALQETAIEGYSDDVYAAVSKLSMAQNAQHLTEALIRALRAH